MKTEGTLPFTRHSPKAVAKSTSVSIAIDLKWLWGSSSMNPMRDWKAETPGTEGPWMNPPTSAFGLGMSGPGCGACTVETPTKFIKDMMSTMASRSVAVGMNWLAPALSSAFRGPDGTEPGNGRLARTLWTLLVVAIVELRVEDIDVVEEYH